jgi:hypothetical protein
MPSHRSEREQRAFEHEKRKYELVARRLDPTGDRGAALRMVRNYLGTEPASSFVAKLREQHPELVDEAERQRRDGVELALLTQNPQLVAALTGAEATDAQRLSELIDALAAEPDLTEVALERALQEGDDDQQLVAAALATYNHHVDLAAPILRLVLTGSPHASHLAVLGARLAPEMAKNVCAQFLADAAWVNPDEPEAKVTEERAHAIFAARCLLPHLGSPLPPVQLDKLPAPLSSEELRSVPDEVETFWQMWQELEERA